MGPAKKISMNGTEADVNDTPTKTNAVEKGSWKKNLLEPIDNSNHLQDKSDDAVGEAWELKYKENGEIEQFLKSSSRKIKLIHILVETISKTYSEMESDLPEMEKICLNMKKLEAEIRHFKRTSPVTIEGSAERENALKSRTVRLKEIKSELIGIKNDFNYLQNRHGNQCSRIMSTLTSFPALVPNNLK